MTSSKDQEGKIEITKKTDLSDSFHLEETIQPIDLKELFQAAQIVQEILGDKL